MSAYKDYREKYQKAKQLYLQGMSISKISKHLGIDRGTLSNNLKAEGIQIINKQNNNRCNENTFETINTEEKAYWLGFLYADGCVSNKTNSIELHLKIEDKNHVEKFKQFINHKNKIYLKTIKLLEKNFKSAGLCFACKKMKEDLINKGCVPQKSLILTFPTNEQVPNHLIHHFIRGYFDGDGSLTYTEKTYRMSINGTEQFLNSLCETMNWEKNSIKERDGKAFRWESNNKHLIPKMLKQIYENSNIYLDRKYNLHLKMIQLPFKMETF